MRAEQAVKEQMSYMEFLEILVNDENLNCSRNRRSELLRRSRIPQHKTIEEFNFSWQPCLNRQSIYSLGTCEFIRKKEDIAFIGLPGSGKTHLSIALGIKVIEQGYTVLFTTLSEMMEDLYMSRADNSFRQKLKKYTAPDLLIVDALGLKKLGQTNVDDLYEVISRRYETSSTIITSNKQFDEWGSILFDLVLATAILDRFVHHCSFVIIEGESYRMKEREHITSTKRRGRQKKTPARSHRKRRWKRMQNKNMIHMLEQLDPNTEICVEIYECISGAFIDSTYAIGYDLNEYGQLVLKVDVVKDKFMDL